MKGLKTANLLVNQVVVQTALEDGVGQGMTPHVQNRTSLGIRNRVIQQGNLRGLLDEVAHGTGTCAGIIDQSALVGTGMEGLENVPLGIGL